jgi:type II secretion system protein H
MAPEVTGPAGHPSSLRAAQKVAIRQLFACPGVPGITHKSLVLRNMRDGTSRAWDGRQQEPHMVQRKSGFTFVEILIVMLVIGIVLGIAYPKLTVLRARNNVLSAKQRVSATIAAARQSAIARGVPVKFVVSGDTIFSVASPYGATDSVQRAFDVHQSYGTTLGGDQFEILFDPRGLATGFKDTKSIYLTYADKADTMCVHVFGRVQMRGC